VVECAGNACSLPLHTIIPALALRDGLPVLCFGVMGGPYQPAGVVRGLQNIVDLGMDVQQALDAISPSVPVARDRTRPSPMLPQPILSSAAWIRGVDADARRGRRPAECQAATLTQQMAHDVVRSLTVAAGRQRRGRFRHRPCCIFVVYPLRYGSFLHGVSPLFNGPGASGSRATCQFAA